MSIVWKYRNNDGSLVEMTGRVRFAGARKEGTDGLVTNAEEGAVARARVRVDDPDSSFEIRGHRLVIAYETEAAGDPYGGVLGIYYANIREVEEASPFDGLGRAWTIDLDDLNTAFDRRIMRGSDANRPAETDVERIQWLEATSECSLIDDTTYLSTADPVDMDAADYRNQRVREIFDDCAQQSGKNWYLLWIADEGAPIGVLFSLWYGDGTLDTFVSDISISNVPADIAAGAYAPAAGSKLRRDPTRVYSGVVVEYAGGSRYRTRDATSTAFALGGRDTTSPAPNVKSATKADARGDRYLETIKTEEDVISTSIVVDAVDVNAVVHGMYVPVRFSWMPGHEESGLGRALNRTVRPLAPGIYELAMELAAAPVVAAETLLIAIMHIGGPGHGGSPPSDLSTNPWTQAFFTGNFASATQFPGPGGGSGMSIWYRQVVPGESATVIQLGGGASKSQGCWVYQVAGVTSVGLQETHGTDDLPYALGGSATVDSPTADVDSVFIGGFMLQKVNYGQCTTMATTQGTALANTNGANVVCVCDEEDPNPPKVWLGYRTGTGALTLGGTLGCDGAGPGDYNHYGRGFGGLLLPLTDTFSVVQTGFAFAVGADVTVTLPSPP